MNILNIMFGQGRGGLEQAAIDYHESLSRLGHNITTVIHPGAAIIPDLAIIGGRYQELSQCGEWDLLAALRLKRLALKARTDLVIAHGNRAIGLALKGMKGRIPIAGVAHNYKIKRRFPRCDAVFCVTRDLVEEMVHLNIPRERLFHIPNMVRASNVPLRTAFHTPPIIGTMGRMVEKKGFEIFLQGIKALKEQGSDAQAILAGTGPLLDKLKAMATEYGIADRVTFPGWIEDTAAFFRSLDIFILPSHHEPFGIVLIEAMAAGLPCITTDTEGPCEIIRHEIDAIMIEKARPYQMAKAVMELLDTPARAFDIGYAAHLKARDRYDIEVVGSQLHNAAGRVINASN